MLRGDSADAVLRWQAFLIDGFKDWLPLATVAASNMLKATPRQVLKGMISDFYFSDGIQQTEDDIGAWMEGYALNSNAMVIDPKTGEAIGRMRELTKDKDGNYVRKPKPKHVPVVDAVRERKAARRKAAADAAAARQQETVPQPDCGTLNA